MRGIVRATISRLVSCSYHHFNERITMDDFDYEYLDWLDRQHQSNFEEQPEA